uniref:Small ribosomal subunit protein uS10 domain-containing protein n=1 Tax=Vannella robusta TaxID=1487602 RepID=A0A7S4I7L9_9EUKA|mmetsp:Transcript_21671/g.27594  ORF Transcript_21671/g.27594 Transcript_21671/m.27594 type:complete len:149 (+) Transcript_21671:24-470(+)
MTLKRVELIFQSYSPDMLNFGLRRVRNALEMVPGLRMVLKYPLPMPVRRRRQSVQKSPFVHKKAHRTLQQDLHRRLLVIEGDSAITNKFLRYLQANIDVTLSAKVIEHSYYPASKFYSFTTSSLASAPCNEPSLEANDDEGPIVAPKE